MMESLVVEIDRVLYVYISLTCMHMFLYPPYSSKPLKIYTLNYIQNLLFYGKTLNFA